MNDENQLKELHKMDPDSTEYFMNGLIDTHYPADQTNMRTCACMSLFNGLTGEKTTRERSCTRSALNLNFLTTSCGILPRRTRERITTILSCFSLYHSGMRVNCYSPMRLQNRRSKGLQVRRALHTVRNCRG